MRKQFSSIFIIIIFSIQAQNQLPKVISGKIDRIENFKSKYVASRNVDIWLPENYSREKKYSVLYMQDGQMLFDPETTWNKQAWNVDDVASQLLKTDKINNFIVVGIWNSGQTRYQDYFPKKPFKKLSKTERDSILNQLQKAGRIKGDFKPQSDKYLKFLTKELKPFIDSNYSVYTNRENTYIAGSSMGGLISMYAICEYPKVFGAAACMSTHWSGIFILENNPIPNQFINYLNKNLPCPELHKIYFDCGGKTLDALYPEIQKRVDAIMISKKYDETNWMTKFFPDDDHSEISWSKRLNIPLEFLLKKE